MRQLLVLLVAALLAGCAAAGDGGGGDTTTSTQAGGDEMPTHPTGADEVVLRISHEGGFVPVEFNLAALPAFTLYGDGTVLVPGPQLAIFPGPALPNIQRLHVDDARVAEIVAAAREAGVRGEDRHYGHGCVADAANTVIALHAGGDVTTVSVYALGLDVPGEGADPGCGVDTEAAEARVALGTFVTSMEGMIFDGSIDPPVEYVPSALRVFVGDEPVSDPDLPQEPVSWPLDTALADFGEPVGELAYRCGVVDGEDALALLEIARSANQLTPWLSAGTSHHITFRPLLPDESGC